MHAHALPGLSLVDHGRLARGTTLATLFAREPDRHERLAWLWHGWRVDISKERLPLAAWRALLEHAQASGLERWRDALFAGEKVNLTEGRAALHTALRQQDDTPVSVDGTDVVPAIRTLQARMAQLVDGIRSGARLGCTGRAFRHAINIGIGGSDLGPLLVCDALTDPAARGELATGFVSNVDPAHLARVLAGRDPERTLFVVTSKTFTTQETLANATAARHWLRDQLGERPELASHFIAVTANAAEARAFGIAETDILPLWDWVGGRYSLWSAVGLTIALQFGYARFAELLAGAAAMDAHFRNAELARNLPVVLGLLGFWNTRYLGHPDRVVVPYAQALARLPAFLQQLMLESNGKRVGRDGSPLTEPSAAALWGEPGTNGQHAFFQWLHQGTREVPVEFIVPVRTTGRDDDRQTLLVANALAQAQALLVGRTEAALRRELAGTVAEGPTLDAAVAARVCPGDRASTLLLLPQIDAWHIGALLALYEQRTFVEAMLFGINPFDQFGVELGKTLAKPMVAALAKGAELPPDTDASTRAAMAHARALVRTAGE